MTSWRDEAKFLFAYYLNGKHWSSFLHDICKCQRWVQLNCRKRNTYMSEVKIIRFKLYIYSFGNVTSDLATLSHSIPAPGGWWMMTGLEQPMEWRLARERSTRGVKLLRCHFVHHKSHITWPGLKHKAPRWEGRDYSSQIWHRLPLSHLLTLHNFLIKRPHFTRKTVGKMKVSCWHLHIRYSEREKQSEVNAGRHSPNTITLKTNQSSLSLESSWGVTRRLRLRLTNSPPSVSQMYKIWVPWHLDNYMVLHGLLQGQLYWYFPNNKLFAVFVSRLCPLSTLLHVTCFASCW
jgi:hypothetical protein